MANYNIIRELCKKKEITLRELSEKTPISITGLQKILTNATTTVDTLEKIAKALEVPVAIFFDEDPNDRIYFSSEEVAAFLDKLHRAQFDGFTDHLFTYWIKESDQKYYITKTGILNLMFAFIEDEKRWNRYGLLIDKLLEEREGLKK